MLPKPDARLKHPSDPDLDILVTGTHSPYVQVMQDNPDADRLEMVEFTPEQLKAFLVWCKENGYDA